MSSLRRRVTLVSSFAAGIAATALLAFAVNAHGAGDEPAPKPVAAIVDVMNAVNEGDTSLLGLLKADLGKEKLDADEWDIVEARAAMIAEAGNVLLGLKPPLGATDDAGVGRWKKHVIDYRTCAEEILGAAKKKDVPAAKTAATGLGKRCGECHKEHRKGDK